jgi:hypothetical protein
MPVAKLAQLGSMDEELRGSLWSLLTLRYWDTYEAPGNDWNSRNDYVRGSNMWQLVLALWLHYFKWPVDTVETYWLECHKKLRAYFFAAKWYEVYDFIEFVVQNGPGREKEEFSKLCNHYLERENSAYRFVGDRITEITSAEEISEVEGALAKAMPFAGVQEHLTSALAHLSSRTNPDYRNSIKESISAVESLAKQLASDSTATLGTVLKALEKSKKLHPALKSAFSSLYGYTSNADGIRHALLDESSLSKADARFMLVCCSAFINYTIESTGN